MSINSKFGKFNGKELQYISEYLDSESMHNEKSWTQRFEEAVSEKLGIKYAIACNSGTSGLHMAMFAAGIGPGDEVITPALTVVMDAYAVIHMGATPVFADVNRDTYTIDIEDIKRKYTSKTKAIVTVSLQGLSAEMDEILEFANQKGLIVIDDSAQNLHGTYNKKPAGTLGHINVLSFENKKHITAGSEGGMVLTNCPHFAVKARKFGGIGYKHMTANAGRTSLALSDVQNPDYERFDTIGLNYRMSEISAAVGLAQFERSCDIVQRRKKVAEIFLNAVKGCNWIKTQYSPDNIEHSFYTFSFEYQGFEKFGLSWRDFYKIYTDAGGDGFYSACVVPYLEPVFQNNEIYNKVYTQGLCPTAESLQKKIMQFKTNYRSLEVAELKASVLKQVIEKIGQK